MNPPTQNQRGGDEGHAERERPEVLLLNHTIAREQSVKDSEGGEGRDRDGNREGDAEERADAEAERASRAARDQGPGYAHEQGVEDEDRPAARVRVAKLASEEAAELATDETADGVHREEEKRPVERRVFRREPPARVPEECRGEPREDGERREEAEEHSEPRIRLSGRERLAELDRAQSAPLVGDARGLSEPRLFACDCRPQPDQPLREVGVGRRGVANAVGATRVVHDSPPSRATRAACASPVSRRHAHSLSASRRRRRARSASSRRATLTTVAWSSKSESISIVRASARRSAPEARPERRASEVCCQCSTSEVCSESGICLTPPSLARSAELDGRGEGSDLCASSRTSARAWTSSERARARCASRRVTLRRWTQRPAASRASPERPDRKNTRLNHRHADIS